VNRVGQSGIRINVESFGYAADRSVLRHVVLNADEGESVAILGGSGSGKSTILKLLAGISPASGSGQVIRGEISLMGQTPDAYRRSGGLSVMFQEPTLLPNRSVRDNIALPLDLKAFPRGQLVDEMLHLVGLEKYAADLPRVLSGGMRTRVALARSFVTEPKLLLLDEPFAALDMLWKRELYASLAELKARFGTTIVMVTHDLQEAVFNSNHIFVLGRKGTPLDTLRIERELPRTFSFSETVEVFTSELAYLGSLLTTDSIRAGAPLASAVTAIDDAASSILNAKGGDAASINLRPVRPWVADAGITARLIEGWRSGNQTTRYAVMWDLLDNPRIEPSLLDDIVEFTLSDLVEFNRQCVSFYGPRAMLDQAVQQRISDREIPATKKWVYLCHLTEARNLVAAEELLRSVLAGADIRFVYPNAIRVAARVLEALGPSAR
jgi:NitT/TauT family transport system ATP-binding protein